jgi:hypothetical protein
MTGWRFDVGGLRDAGSRRLLNPWSLLKIAEVAMKP